MNAEEQIPGHSVISQWQPEPIRPLKLIEADVWRYMQGSFGPPGFVVIHDAVGREYRFGFDSFLFRLFAGAINERDEAAAWVDVRSPLLKEVTDLLRAAALANPDWSWLTRYVDRALLK